MLALLETEVGLLKGPTNSGTASNELSNQNHKEKMRLRDIKGSLGEGKRNTEQSCIVGTRKMLNYY